jgi:hypothetical protein
MLTAWGDCGGETSVFAALPVIFQYAQRAYGVTDAAALAARFSDMFGCFDSFMRLESAAHLDPARYPAPNSSTKFFLFNDTFTGFLDNNARAEYGKAYSRAACDIREAGKKVKGFSYLFDTQAALADALHVKYDLGVKTRAAYNGGDKAGLVRLARNEYTRAIRAVRKFFDIFKRQWYLENKTCGFDVQEIRFGACLFRMEQNRSRLIAYATGEYEKIEELEEAVLDDFGADYTAVVQNWGEIATANTLIEYFSYV